MEYLLLTKDEVHLRCGAGMGARCCRFILFGPEGFYCGRDTDLHEVLLSHDSFVAQRKPTEPYPQCQLPIQ